MLRRMSDQNSKRFAGRHLWEYAFVQDLFWIGLAGLLLWLGYYLRSIFNPLLIAFGLAYIAHPLIEKLYQTWQIPRLVTAVGLLITVLATVALLFVFLAPQVSDEVGQFIERAPDYVDQITRQLGFPKEEIGNNLQKRINDALKRDGGMSDWMLTSAARAFGVIGDAFSGLMYLGIAAMLIPIYFVYFGWQYGPLLEQARQFIPEKHRERVVELASKMDQAVGHFIRGRLLVAFCMCIMFSVGWWMADVPYWFLLGTITGLLSIVPYLAAVGWPLAVLLKSLESSSFSWMDVVVWPSLVYCVVQLLEGWLLTPWIQSKSTSMGAATILIVVMIGGALGGVYGLLLAIPLAACLKILAQEVVAPRLKRWADDA